MIFAVSQFEKFYDCLMQGAPVDFTPHFFSTEKNGKNPDALAIMARASPKSSCHNQEWIKDAEGKMICPECKTRKGSWKAPWARLSKEECIARLKAGGNIGLGAMENDCLVLIDLDDDSVPDLKFPTLGPKSRTRTGRHRICFTKDKRCKTNIPTQGKGEVRSCNEYVNTVGSFVPCTDEEIKNLPEEEKPFAGFYTVEKAVAPAWITFEDFPEIFKEQVAKAREFEKTALKATTIKPTGKRSALFDLKIEDVVSSSKFRFPHPVHDSKTGQNFSISWGLAHCWRCQVSLNPIQLLCVAAGYLSCVDAGTAHKNSHAGASKATGDNGAIFYAWLQAKKIGIIPENDPIPIKAMRFIAVKHAVAAGPRLEELTAGGCLSKAERQAAIEIVEGEY